LEKQKRKERGEDNTNGEEDDHSVEMVGFKWGKDRKKKPKGISREADTGYK